MEYRIVKIKLEELFDNREKMRNRGIPRSNASLLGLGLALLCIFFMIQAAEAHPLKYMYMYAIDPCRKPGGPHPGCRRLHKGLPGQDLSWRRSPRARSRGRSN